MAICDDLIAQLSHHDVVFSIACLTERAWLVPEEGEKRDNVKNVKPVYYPLDPRGLYQQK
jgi:hypothetical protein